MQPHPRFTDSAADAATSAQSPIFHKIPQISLIWIDMEDCRDLVDPACIVLANAIAYACTSPGAVLAMGLILVSPSAIVHRYGMQYGATYGPYEQRISIRV